MLKTTCLHSTDELRAIASEWNDLWQRSEPTSAVHRAETLLSFLEYFMPDARLSILMVRDEDRLVATLPVVATRRLLGQTIGALPNNEWSQPGTLLLDPDADHAAVLAELATGLAQSDFSLIRFDQIDLDAPAWADLQATFNEKKIPHQAVFQYDLGTVDVRGNFETFLTERSKNLRSTLRRRRRRLEEQGEVRFTMLDRFSLEAGTQPLEPLLQKIFSLEKKSWKHDTGGAVLDHPDVFEFYVRLAQLMDENHFMRIALLELDGQLIAYDLAVESKRAYHSYKVSYDPAFGRYGPGQLLHEDIIRFACDSPELDTIEFCGPMDDAIAAWATSHHRFGHLTFSPQVGSLSSRLVWLAYRAVAGVRRWGR